jgi:hypothetical protein
MKSKWRNLTVGKERYKFTASFPKAVCVVPEKIIVIRFEAKLVIHRLEDNKKIIVPYPQFWESLNKWGNPHLTYGGKLPCSKIVSEYIKLYLQKFTGKPSLDICFNSKKPYRPMYVCRECSKANKIHSLERKGFKDSHYLTCSSCQKWRGPMPLKEAQKYFTRYEYIYLKSPE